MEKWRYLSFSYKLNKDGMIVYMIHHDMLWAREFLALDSDCRKDDTNFFFVSFLWRGALD